MATRAQVPRADGESSIGVPTKKWGNIFAYKIDEATDIGNNASLGYRQPSTTYAVGAVKHNASLPTGMYLECTTAGTSGSGTLTISTPTVGGTVSDGTVTWTVRKNASTQDLTAYLPLSGGAMTGTGIERSVNDSSIFIVGGNTNTPGVLAPGAQLALMGMDSGNSGEFFLQSYNKAANVIKQLYGKPDGTLAWDGNSLDKSAVVAESLGQTGYRKYASGKIEQWGQISISNDTEVTLPISFQYSSSYQVFIGAFNTSTYSYGAQPVSASSFKAFTSSPQAIGVRYFAIGI